MANYLSLPSGSNTTGTALGTLVGGAVLSYLTNAAFMVGVAASIGIPPATIAAVGSLVAGMLVNYAVTHISEVKNFNDIVAKLPSTYPADPNNSLH